MNTSQIDAVLNSLGPFFKGTHAMDLLPPYTAGAYVINLSPSSDPGTHWVVVYHDSNCIEYFDSYGSDPPKYLIRWWGKNRIWTKNPYKLQSPLSSVCGQYCIFYILHRFQGYKISTVLNLFSDDVDHNDRQVYHYVRENFELERLPLLDTKGVVMQIARALLTD